MDTATLNETRAVVARQWHLQLDETGSLALLLDALAERILLLLDSDKDKLMRALYILDIHEKRYKLAMTRPTQQDRARALAQAVIDRETEKIETRRRYASSGGSCISGAFDQQDPAP